MVTQHHDTNCPNWHRLSSFIAVHNVINRRLPATTLILEFSFFLLQQGKSNSLELAAAEYRTAGIPATVKKAVKDALSQDDGDDNKLCNMIINIILQNRMCGCHLSWR
jgi:hypothetical protein